MKTINSIISKLILKQSNGKEAIITNDSEKGFILDSPDVIYWDMGRCYDWKSAFIMAEDCLSLREDITILEVEIELKEVKHLKGIAAIKLIDLLQSVEPSL